MSNMNKGRKAFRIGALLLVVCLISTVMLSGTFAKYTSEYAGQDTALVARWSFAAKEGPSGERTLGAVEDNTELALFDHLYDTHMNQTAADGTTYIIAPGVGHNFTLKMDYLADVDADVEIKFDKLADSANVPIEYSTDGGTTWVTLDNLADALADQIIANTAYGDAIDDTQPAAGKFRITAVDNASTTPVLISETVKWKWRYAKEEAGSAYSAQTDAQDTALGEASKNAGINRTKYGIKVTLTATQVTPATE
jgi:hypothetical protein